MSVVRKVRKAAICTFLTVIEMPKRRRSLDQQSSDSSHSIEPSADLSNVGCSRSALICFFSLLSDDVECASRLTSVGCAVSKISSASLLARLLSAQPRTRPATTKAHTNHQQDSGHSK
eukprot:1865742-Pleurochrysis_carterae.AAC.3